MSLEKYKQKRTFTQTPEPAGGKAADKVLHFVVQQHHASHLHYDFRLEMKGVLKSWAVPKGPSMDPEIKRLAMMVEDHPYDYKDFEGSIPAGNYGAGTVIVWDAGLYTPEEAAKGSKQQQTNDLLHQLHSGKLKFTLQGKKLKGNFALVKAPGRGDNAWLLMKLKDCYATTNDITLKNKSVLSGKTLEQVAKNPHKEWKSNKEQPITKASIKKRTTAKTTPEKASPVADDISLIIKKGKKAPMPAGVKPMLAAVTAAPFDKEDWLYEIKWDGYRAIAYLRNGKVELHSRNQLSFNEKFAVITNALKDWNIKAVTDGEIVAIDGKGNPDFQALQNYFKHGKSAHLVYYMFDLLWYNGKDYRHLPLLERKQLLQQLIPQDNDLLRYSRHITGDGIRFYQAAVNKGLEGIMAKAAESSYVMSRRSESWLKIKNNQHMEAIICGYTAGRNNRKHFGAVILGKYENGVLKYIGHTGGGFSEQQLKSLFIKFQPLITSVCPFKPKPATNMPATWLKPELVCEVKFTESTQDGILRQPIFIGLREDKKAADEKQVKITPPPSKKVAKRTTFLPENENQAEIKSDGKLLKFTNLDKLYWPKEGITKRDMINYYADIADYILPYLRDRPQSLNRFPEGITGFSFYQKNVEDKVASWIKRFPYTSDSDGETKEFMVCTDKASLLYMANLGCIELNPWHSRISKPDYPDYCLIDLDPDTNTFDQVIETALEIKSILDDIGANAYVKTSGATGMHILIPLGAKYTFEQSRMLAELIVGIANRRLPTTTSILRTPAKRKGKIYLDFLQNRQIQTMASAYSLRPRPGATASAPLRWEEVKKGLKVTDFNIYNLPQRLAREGDLLKGLLGKGINMKTVLSKLKNLL